MRMYFRFKYLKKKSSRHPEIVELHEPSAYGQATVEVWSLSDIEELMRVSGLKVRNLFIVSTVRDGRETIRSRTWGERGFVCGTKKGKETVCIGECNFYEDNGKGDS